FYDAPLRMRYEGLDPSARYQLAVVYSGDSPSVPIRLQADGIEVHPYISKRPAFDVPVTFDVPARATADGRLELQWNAEPGRGGNGRGCQVAEVWLKRTAPGLSERPGTGRPR